jgi:hypothetical protein
MTPTEERLMADFERVVGPLPPHTHVMESYGSMTLCGLRVAHMMKHVAVVTRAVGQKWLAQGVLGREVDCLTCVEKMKCASK